jgi:YggT family protein
MQADPAFACDPPRIGARAGEISGENGRANMSLVDSIIHLLLIPVLNLFLILLIASIILSWLISFKIVNPYNPVVSTIWRITSTLTEPVLRPIRSILPSMGGFDFSPLVAFLLVQFVIYALRGGIVSIF